MLQYLSVVLFMLCLVHYVYQAIFLPTFRQQARDELFVLRDQLRTRLIEIQDSSDRKTINAFKEVDDAINRALNRLNMLTFSNFLAATLKQEELARVRKADSQKFHDLIESANDAIPQQVLTKSCNVLMKVLAANSAMFLIYLMPFVVMAKLIKSIYKQASWARAYVVDRVLVELAI